MARHGLLIDYEYCTGCHTCEVACKQEHNYPVGKWGIKVNEIVLETFEKIAIDYIPFPTDLCNLCVERTKEGIPPACVKHCQAGCMMYGPVKELAKVMDKKPKDSSLCAEVRPLRIKKYSFSDIFRGSPVLLKKRNGRCQSKS